MHILLVDDDDDVREVLSLILRTEGYEVQEAIDGVDALGLLRAGSRPAVILLDMMMPKMDGHDFLRIVKRDPALAHIPIFIISGDQAARRKADELGAAGCLLKPIELDDMFQVLRGIGAGDASHP